MLDTLTRNIKWGKTFCCVEHSGGERPEVLLITTRATKGELEINSLHTFETVGQVCEALPQKQHLHLVVSSEQVLFRVFESNQETSNDNIVLQAFPNLDLSLFYYDIVKNRSKSLVFICRKDYIAEIIASYNKRNIFVVSWSIGTSVLDILIPYIDEQVIHTNNYAVKIQNDTQSTISSIKDNQVADLAFAKTEITTFTYQIEDIVISSKHILGLAGAFAVFSSQRATECTNSSERQQEANASYLQHQFFSKGIIVALGILFTVFLVNFLVYSYYYDKVEELSGIATVNQSQKKLLIKKEASVNEKQKLYEDVIRSSSSRSSFYIDQLIEVMPDEIQLEELAYQPLERTPKPEKVILLLEKTISIKGITPSTPLVTQWITNIENLEFTDKVFIKDFATSNGETQFLIEMTLLQ